MLCANKNDLEDQRVVDKAKAEEEAKKLGLIHMETSAKTGHNITEAFKALVRETVRTSFEYKVRNIQEKSYTGEAALHRLFTPSCHRTWKGVVVPLDSFLSLLRKSRRLLAAIFA